MSEYTLIVNEGGGLTITLNGAAGPAGPAGATGATGPQGPQGPSFETTASILAKIDGAAAVGNKIGAEYLPDALSGGRSPSYMPAIKQHVEDTISGTVVLAGGDASANVFSDGSLLATVQFFVLEVNTDVDIAGVIRSALAANSTVTSIFDVTGTGTQVGIRSKVGGYLSNPIYIDLALGTLEVIGLPSSISTVITAGVDAEAAIPASYIGQLYRDTAAGTWYQWNGTEWPEGAFINSVSGTGAQIFSENGVGAQIFSDTMTGAQIYSNSGIYHAEFGNSGDDRSFVASETGAFGWFRGAFTGRIAAMDTLTDNRTYTLPDESGFIAMVNDPRFTDERMPLAHPHSVSDIVSQAGGGQRLFGRSQVFAGAGEEIPVPLNGGLNLGSSGLVIQNFGVTDTMLNGNSVTNAKLAHMAGGTVKGRAIGAAGDPVDLTTAQQLTLTAAAFNAGTEDTTPADADRLAVTSPAGGWITLLRLRDYIQTWLNTPLTIAGLKSFSGRVELTPSQQTTTNSALTIGMGDARYLITRTQHSYGTLAGVDTALGPLGFGRVDSAYGFSHGDSNTPAQCLPFFSNAGKSFQTVRIEHLAGTHPTAILEVGVYLANNVGMPSDFVAKASFSLSSIGIKTLSFASPLTITGLFWLVVRPSLGNTLFTSGGNGQGLSIRGYSNGQNSFASQQFGFGVSSGFANFTGTLMPVRTSQVTLLPTSNILSEMTLTQIASSPYPSMIIF